MVHKGERYMLTIKDLEIKFNSLILKVDEITFNYGNIYGITGESGSGKSCFLDCIALFHHHWKFTYFYNNQKIVDYDSFRQEHIAYLSQQENLLIELTCQQHIELLCGNRELSEDLLNQFLIDFELTAYPNMLSGGERLRFSLLLMYLSNADILVLDEVTASLDEDNSLKIADLINKLAHEENKIIILATHDPILKEICDMLYQIEYCELVLKEKKVEHGVNRAAVQKPIRGNFFKNLVLPQYKNMANKKLILVMLSILMLCISLTGIQVGYTHSEGFNNLIETVGREQSYIMSEDRWINNNILPFSTNDVESYMVSNPDVVSYYPFSSFLTASKYIDRRTYFKSDDNETNNLVDLENTDGSFLYQYIVTDANEERSITKEVDTQKISSEPIYPYFDESALDYKCTQMVDVDGIYLSASFAATLGIASLDENTSITMNFLVPTARVQLQTKDHNTSEILFETSKFILYDVETMTFKVRGILDRQYIQPTKNFLFYLEHEKYDEILTNHTQQIIPRIDTFSREDYVVDLTNRGYTDNIIKSCNNYFSRFNDQETKITITVEPFTQNLYTIFTKGNTSIKSIEKDLKAINENYGLLNMGEIMNTSKISMDILDQYFNSFNLIFIFAVIVFSFIINHFNKTKRSEMLSVLLRLGFTKKEFKKYLISDIKFNILVTIGFGLAFLFMANIFALIFKFMTFNSLYLKSLFIVTIGLIPLSALLVIIQNLSSYSLVKNDDKN